MVLIKKEIVSSFLSYLKTSRQGKKEESSKWKSRKLLSTELWSNVLKGDGMKEDKRRREREDKRKYYEDTKVF